MFLLGLSSATRPTPTVLAGIDRVYVIAVDRDSGALLMVRHQTDKHVAWTYPSRRKSHPRIPAHVMADRLLREDLHVEHSGLHMVQVLPATGERRAAAVYTALVTGGATGEGEAEKCRLQRLTLTRDMLTTLDIRPADVSQLLSRAGRDPATAVRVLIAAAARDDTETGQAA